MEPEITFTIFERLFFFRSCKQKKLFNFQLNDYNLNTFISPAQHFFQFIVRGYVPFVNVSGKGVGVDLKKFKNTSSLEFID